MATCANCSAEVSDGSVILVQGKSKKAPSIPLCPNCVTNTENAIVAETKGHNLPVAILLGLVAAVVGSLVWYGLVVLTNYQLGIVAVGIGWLVAQAVMRGAGRKRGPRLQAISVIFTLLGMAFSEYLIVRHFAVQALAAEGYTNIPLLLPLDTMLNLIIEGVKADLLTLLFWAIALWEAFVIPGQRRLRRVNG
jgi:hypothetical protein